MGAEPRVIGRYALYGEIAAGGMATVHYGRLLGPVGFSRTVAIKRLHPQYAKDPEFVAMFLDEARLAARVRHPNVVPTLDVVALEGELFLIMDYVQGEALSKLARKRQVPPRIAAAIMCGALHGLHAAHEARNERGEPLDIVHRDVSPQNILVGTDGIARVLDFGVAKASGRMQTTKEGQIKGKISYMAPEQFRGAVTRQTDIYAAAIVTWEVLTGERLFGGGDEIEVLAKALSGKVEAPSALARDLPAGLDAIVLRGLAPEPADRYATAREMALELERCCGIASPSEVGAWVDGLAKEVLSRRSAMVQDIEAATATSAPLDTAAAASIEAREKPKRRPARPASPEDETQSEAVSLGPARAEETSSAVVVPRPPLVARSWVVAVLALFGVAAIAIFVRLVWPGSQAARASTPIGPAPSATALPPAISATAVAELAPSEPVSTASAAAAPASAAPLPAAPRPATDKKPAAATRTAAKPGCDPPYTIDGNGRKHFKVECL